MPTDKPADDTPTSPDDTPPDSPPPVTRREAADIAKASVISTADIDAAGAMWRRYAGAGLAGLWEAAGEGGDA